VAEKHRSRCYCTVLCDYCTSLATSTAVGAVDGVAPKGLWMVTVGWDGMRCDVVKVRGKGREGKLCSPSVAKGRITTRHPPPICMAEHAIQPHYDSFIPFAYSHTRTHTHTHTPEAHRERAAAYRPGPYRLRIRRVEAKQTVLLDGLGRKIPTRRALSLLLRAFRQ